MLAIDDGLPRLSALPPLIQRLVDRLQQDGLTVAPVDGSFETAGYELGILLQSSATNHSLNKRMISLWLSPSVRCKFQESERKALLQAQFDAVEIPTVEADLGEYLRDLKTRPTNQPCDEMFRTAVQSYLANCDIVRLWNLRQRWPSWQLVRLMDVASGQAFLLASPEASRIPVVFNLSGSINRERQVVIESLNVEAIREFVRSRRIARDQEPTMNLRKAFLIGLLLALVGAAAKPAILRKWQDFREHRRLERFEVDAARTAAYPLESNEWLEFSIPHQARALRVLTNAAVPDLHDRSKTREEPRFGWRYAIQYELLDPEGDVLDGTQYHFRAVVIKRPDAETGKMQSASWFGDSDQLPTMTRTAQLPFDSAPEKPSRLRVRLAKRDPEVQEVVVRVYMQYERSDYQQPFVWSRLSPETRERLCRPLVYAPSLLTATEKQNLARWDWTALPPKGLEGRDYRTRWFYQSAPDPSRVKRRSSLPRVHSVGPISSSYCLCRRKPVRCELPVSDRISGRKHLPLLASCPPSKEPCHTVAPPSPPISGTILRFVSWWKRIPPHRDRVTCTDRSSNNIRTRWKFQPPADGSKCGPPPPSSARRSGPLQANRRLRAIANWSSPYALYGPF